jgi:SAM-dependent methyltransferase
MRGTSIGSQNRTEEHSRFWESQWLWWDRIEAPLRPGPEDVLALERTLEELQKQCGRSLVAVQLGVTPEFARLRWPSETALTAVDKSQGMIDHVWPKDGLRGARAKRGDWLALPFADQSVDIVLGDGCFSQVRYPDMAADLCRELARVLRPNGCLALRTFTRPDDADTSVAGTVEALFDALERGEFASFHAFKWRLNMALQPSLEAGVRLGDVYDAFFARYSSPEVVANARGFSVQSVETIRAYEGSDARFYYPTLGELRRVLGQHFVELAQFHPSYELGPCCPHFRLRPTPTA